MMPAIFTFGAKEGYIYEGDPCQLILKQAADQAKPVYDITKAARKVQVYANMSKVYNGLE